MRIIISNKLKMFIMGFITFNVLWYGAAKLINRKILISPIEVYKHLPSILPGMGIHLGASLSRIFWGILIAAIIGSVLGGLMAYSKRISKLLSPLIYFAYPVPKLALLPILMLLLGLGDQTKIAMIVLIIVFQIIVAVRDAILNIPRETYHVLISQGAKKHHILMHITMPAILAEGFTSLKIALGTAISVLFFTETYGTQKGMGYFIMDAWMRVDYKGMYGGIVLLSCMGCLLFILIDSLNEQFCKWKR